MKSFCIGLMLCWMFAVSGLAANGWRYFTKNFEPGYQIEQKRITAAAENEEGFLIIGTKGALYAFDGRYYQPMLFPDTLLDVEVTSIAGWSEGVLVGLSDGKLLFYKNIHIHSEPNLLFTAATKISSIATTNNGGYAVASYGNGIYLSTETGILHLLNGLSLYCIVSDNDGNYWAGSDAGLIHIFYTGKDWATKTYDTDSGLPDRIVTALHFDETGKLWIGMHDGGYCQFDPTLQQWYYPESRDWTYGVVQSIYSQNQQLWLGSAEMGVFKNDIQTSVFESFNEPASTRLIQLVPSKLNGFWIIGQEQISWTSGVDIGMITHPGGLASEDIIAIHAFSNNQLWISNSEGLFLINPSKNHITKLKISNSENDAVPVISCFFAPDEHQIWAGSFGNGLFLLNKDGAVLQHFTEADGLPNNSILSIKGTGKQLIIASLGGAGFANLTANGQWKFSRFDNEPGPGTNYVYDVLYDQSGRPWFATDGKGAGYFEHDRFQPLTHELLADKTIYTISEDERGAIWLSVPDEGLYRVFRDSITNFGLQQGLSSLVINALISLDNEFIVAGGLNGIDLINTKTFEILQLGTMYGLETGQTALHGIHRASNGALYVATEHAVFQLQNASQIFQRLPITVPWQLLVNFQPIDFEKSSVFSYNQRQLGIAVSTLWYPNPDVVQLHAELSGKNTQSFTTRDQNINLGQLSPGSYQLDLVATAASQNYGQPENFVFRIKHPFWQNWWFLLPAFITMALLIRFWLKEREKKIRKEQEMIREKLSFEYQNLRNQVNPHFLFNSFSTLLALIETQGKEAGKYVEKLSDYFRQILQYRDTEMISIEEELQLLETYIFLQKQRYGEALQTSITLPEKAFQSRIPPMTLQMLTENALKHNIATKSKPLFLEISAENSFILVKNNIQTKQSKEVSTGLGIDNISNRYRLFAGKDILIKNNSLHYMVYLPFIH